MMGLRRGDQVDLVIEKLVPGGNGLAHHNGQVVFVRWGIPGSTVRARVMKHKRSYAEAFAREVLTPAPVEQAARCPHFRTCGGCAFQQLPYAEQLRVKEDFVREAIEGIGKLAVPLRTILGSPDEWYYRNKVEFSFGQDANRIPTIGYKLPGVFNAILPVDTCPIFDPRADALLAATRAWIPHAGVPVYVDEKRGGVLQYLVLRRSIATNELLVHLVLRANAPTETLASVAHAFARDVLATLATPPDHALATFNTRGVGIPEDAERLQLRGNAAIEERLGGLTFTISPTSFFQTNTRGAERLVSVVHDAIMPRGTERVLDLYCGTGTIGQILAPHVASVLGVELHAPAVEDARRNAAQNALANYDARAADIHAAVRAEPALFCDADVVILDPPRAGLAPAAIEDVRTIRAPRIVYVSCNPATLARDAALLADTYTPEWVQPVDLFPHTPHVESVMLLTRRGE